MWDFVETNSSAEYETHTDKKKKKLFPYLYFFQRQNQARMSTFDFNVVFWMGNMKQFLDQKTANNTAVEEYVITVKKHC